LISNTQSTASAGSFSKRGVRGLKEKLAEIETFKDILVQQVDTLQKYFDDCTENAKNLQSKGQVSDEKDDEICFDPAEQAIDFKGEAITFKATSEGVIATLQHCVDLMVQREDAWRKRWEKEMEKRRKLQEFCRSLKEQVTLNGGVSGRPRVVIHGGPDYEVSYLSYSAHNIHARIFC
jgi:collagen type IV alpha-3-binding protein